MEELDQKPHQPLSIESNLQRLRNHAPHDSTETIARLLSPRRVSSSSAPAPRSTAPERIGPYVIVGEIARGGMGTVYEARHINLGRSVAIKLLGEGQILSRRQADQVLREWRAHGRLSHPNIVTATDAGLIDRRPYLVTELVPGQDLASIVKATGPMHTADAAAIVHDVAEALTYAHREGVAHLDIKPSNVMLRSDGQVKLLDLGTARVASLSARSTDPASNDPAEVIIEEFGTLGYLAPERTNTKPGQLAGDVQDPYAADIYSLGCTFYFLLHGDAPFGTLNHDIDGPTTVQLMRAHRKAPPPPLEFHRDDSATTDQRERLGSLAYRMLSKQPADRPTATEVADQLAGLAIDANRQRIIARAQSHFPIDQEARTGQTVQLTDLVPRSVRARFPGWAYIMAGMLAVLSPLILWAFWPSQGPADIDTMAAAPAIRETAAWNWSPDRNAGFLSNPVHTLRQQQTSDPTVQAVALVSKTPRTEVIQIAWSASGRKLAILSQHHNLRIYRWEDERLELTALINQSEDPIETFTWHPQEDRLAVASDSLLPSSPRRMTAVSNNPNNGNLCKAAP